MHTKFGQIRTKCSQQSLMIREHPFNLKGGGIFSVSTFDGENILKALNALKTIVFVEKNNVATTCREKYVPLRREAKKIISVS